MAVTVLNTDTKVNLKYSADSKSNLSAYTLGIEVLNDADDQKYYELASALIPIVNAEGRTCSEITLTLVKVIA